MIGTPDVDAVYEVAGEVSWVVGQEVNPVVLTPPEWRSRRSGFVKKVRNGPLVAVAP